MKTPEEDGAAMSKKSQGLSTPFVHHSLALLESAAWKAQTPPLRKIIDRLEVEHMRHGGQGNGRLFVSYGQFVAENISCKSIAPAITLGKKLGLIDINKRAVPSGGVIRAPTAYRLTYLPALDKPPTNEWKSASAHMKALAIISKPSKKSAGKRVPVGKRERSKDYYRTVQVLIVALFPVVIREQPSIFSGWAAGCLFFNSNADKQLGQIEGVRSMEV